VARGPKWVPVGLASLVEKAPPPSSAPDSAVQEFDAAQPVKHAASSDPVIDRIFGGKYRVLDRLGAGGMAVVYRAQEQGLITREVALKVLTPESALSQATIARFLKEAQAISNVKHPNVVQLIDLGRTDDGQIYLVMERLVGKTLHEELRGMGENGEAFTWERLAPLILDICGALQAAHKQKVIHRDMKPSNCFLCERDDERPYIKVLDFGIAKVQSGGVSDDSIETPLTQEGMFLGTPNYAAPEISNPGPEQTLDGRVDIFSVGVLMYQCLTGTLPFQEVRGNRLAVLYKTANERPESPRSRAPDLDIPFDVDALVMRAMEIKPGDRFATVAELAGAIRATLQAPGTTPGSGGLSVSGSILEITPPAVVNVPAERTPHKIVVLGTSGPDLRAQPPAEQQSTPVPPGHPLTASTPDSPTSIQDTGRRASMAVLAILAAMALGLVVLFALIIHESGKSPVPPEGRQRSPASADSSEAPPRAVRPSAGEPPVAPKPPLSAAPSVLPVALPSTEPSEPPPSPSAPETPPPGVEDGGAEVPAEAPPPQAPGASGPVTPKGPSADPQAARKKAVRLRLNELAKSDAVVMCLPVSLSFGDKVFDEIPIVVLLDAGGKAKVSIAKKKVPRRVPASADTCIVKVLGSAVFPPGDGPLPVPHTLRFD
jgi:serine/threonine protein kinase